MKMEDECESWSENLEKTAYTLKEDFKDIIQEILRTDIGSKLTEFWMCYFVNATPSLTIHPPTWLERLKAKSHTTCRAPAVPCC